jgi:hypothetical protein
MRISRSIFPSYNINPVTTLGDAWGQGTATYEDPESWATLETGVPGITAAVAENQAPGESWIDTLAKLAQTLIVTDSQRQFLKTNLELAKQGKPPISASAYGMGVSVGIDPSTKNMIMALGAGALAIGALSLMNRGNRGSNRSRR